MTHMRSIIDCRPAVVPCHCVAFLGYKFFLEDKNEFENGEAKFNENKIDCFNFPYKEGKKKKGSKNGKMTKATKSQIITASLLHGHL